MTFKKHNECPFYFITFIKWFKIRHVEKLYHNNPHRNKNEEFLCIFWYHRFGFFFLLIYIVTTDYAPLISW